MMRGEEVLSRGAALEALPPSLASPPSRVPFGLLTKTSRREKRTTRFFLLREGVLLYYDASSARSRSEGALLPPEKLPRATGSEPAARSLWST